MTDTTEEQQNFEILDEKTVQTMDYILRGLELGKFNDTAKKVEFLGKLSGDKSPKYIATLLGRIKKLEDENLELEGQLANHNSRIIELENTKIELEAKINTLDNDMRDVATAIRQLFEPQPLKQNWDMNEIQNFCSRRGSI